jgi:copper chaperone CopZ
MTCDSCVFTITSTVGKKIPGIKFATIDLATKIATFIYDPSVTATDFIIEHIYDLNEGFTASDVTEQTFVLHIQGLNCGRCVAKIESNLPNVKVNLTQGKAFCRNHDQSGQKSEDFVIKSVQNLGFKALLFGPNQGRIVVNVSSISQKNNFLSDWDPWRVL